jgi:hypothetical protein
MRPTQSQALHWGKAIDEERPMTAVQTPPTQLEAKDFFRAAYENRYTWDETFPGYSADVIYKCGDAEFQGKAKVSPDPRMGFAGEVTGIEDEEVLKAFQGQLWEIAVHRVRRPFDKTHAKNDFAYGETKENGAVELIIVNGAEGDRYEVTDKGNGKEVTLVHRHMHGTVVTIHTQSSHDTGEGYLSHEYDSVYADPKTGEPTSGVSLFVDEYEQVEGYHILNRRSIAPKDGSAPAAEFLFTNIELLK